LCLRRKLLTGFARLGRRLVAPCHLNLNNLSLFFVVCLGLLLLTGAVGHYSALWFTVTIFASIKVD
jgi:hypothetical protein